MRMKLFAGVALVAFALPGAAYAQSTGSIDFENDIIITGARNAGVAGIEVPDTSKAKQVLTQEFISRMAPGQTINDTINQMPGVSFQNNDPFGSSGGTLTIRGFDSTRISQTFDGIPLNDSGNYALYSNQQLDPELIEQVNVNLGTTDVDSPTAAATGSTVNYRTIVPTKNFSVKLVGSRGDFDFFRTFGVVNTGEIFAGGPRIFLAASQARNNVVFNNIGRIEKQQYNGRIYQELGNGDFLSVSAHYNVNRNNFMGSLPLRQDLTIDTVSGTAPNQVINSNPRVVGSGSANRFPIGDEAARYTIPLCQTNQVARAGVADLANSCGSTFDERYNPSKTGNIRGSSRFTLSDQLVFTFDPSYQWVQANGGGTAVAQEGWRDVNPTGGNANCNTTPNGADVSCQYGYIGGTPYFGRDMNGDGDTLDTVRVLVPSQTGTRRIGVITGLRYEMSDTQTIRASYTYDRARHRQTGEVGLLLPNGKPKYVFPISDPLTDAGGNVLQKRDRLSYAILHQFSAEYRGAFFDEKLVLRAGVAMKFLKRNLTNYCATSSAAGFVECFGTNDAGLAAYLAANPTVNAIPGQPPQAMQGPQQRILNYKKATPDVGITFKFSPQASIFANFSQGIQVPGTDNLYNAFFFAFDTPQAQPKPEKTDNFDVGFRYSSSKVQAQIGAWYTDYHDRLASSYDPDLEKSIYRNLGRVKKYGFDGSLSYRPIREFSLYGFGSYLHSEIQDDVLVGRTASGTALYAPTAGKREGGAPVYTFGGGATLDLAFVSLGVNAKRTGPRYIYDTNEPVRQQLNVNGQPVIKQIFDNKTPAYTLVDFNARLGLDWAGLGDKTFFQFNLLNAFNEKYVGGFTANLNQGPTYNSTTGAITNYGSPPNAQLGYPRTFIGSVVVAF